MEDSDFIEFIERFEKKKDEEICPEAWAEGEVNLQEITVGQLTDYLEVWKRSGYSGLNLGTSPVTSNS